MSSIQLYIDCILYPEILFQLMKVLVFFFHGVFSFLFFQPI